MSIAYKASVSPIDMQDGRRRAWRVEPNRFEVISRDSTERYSVEVLGGMPICNCTAARYGRPCWHAALVLARLEREAKAGACAQCGHSQSAHRLYYEPDDEEPWSWCDECGGQCEFRSASKFEPTEAELFAMVGGEA